MKIIIMMTMSMMMTMTMLMMMMTILSSGRNSPCLITRVALGRWPEPVSHKNTHHPDHPDHHDHRGEHEHDDQEHYDPDNN